MSRRFNSKDYLVVSYNLDRQVQGEYTNYQVTMVIKSKKSYDEGYLLQLMQEFPRSDSGENRIKGITAVFPSDISNIARACPACASGD